MPESGDDLDGKAFWQTISFKDREEAEADLTVSLGHPSHLQLSAPSPGNAACSSGLQHISGCGIHRIGVGEGI